MMPQNRWIAHHVENPEARLRLFCFHHAGGAANVFRAWQSSLPAAVELCPVQLPGHSTRAAEPLVRDIGVLAEAAVSALLPELSLPYVFFGHSLGALVAFEIAQRLHRAGAPMPRHLLVSARCAPSVPLRYPALHTLSDRDFVDRLERHEGAIPAAIANEPDLLAMMLPALRADFEVNETYVHPATPVPLPCPITVYGGTRDVISEEDLDAWRNGTTSRFARHTFEGDHFFVHAKTSPFKATLSKDLVAIIQALE